jgi:hypothetical protein
VKTTNVEDSLAAGVNWTSQPTADLAGLRRRGIALKWRRRIIVLIVLAVVGGVTSLGIVPQIFPSDRSEPVAPAGGPRILPDSCAGENDCTPVPPSTPSDLDEPPGRGEPGYVEPGPERGPVGEPDEGSGAGADDSTDG